MLPRQFLRSTAAVVGALLLVSLVPSAQAAARLPCTKPAIGKVVSGKVLTKTCAKGWAAGTVRFRRAGTDSRYIVKARRAGGWGALDQRQLAKACARNSPVPRKVLRVSPCQAG